MKDNRKCVAMQPRFGDIVSWALNQVRKVSIEDKAMRKIRKITVLKNNKLKKSNA